MSFDLACLALVALFAVWGLVRGLVRQIFGMAGFVGGVVLARLFAQPFGVAFAKDLQLPVGVATAAMAFCIFVACEVAAKIIGGLLYASLKGGFTGAADRMGGFVLGFCKGLLGAWALASMVVVIRPHLPHVERDTPLAKLDLQHSQLVSIATRENLIAEVHGAR